MAYAMMFGILNWVVYCHRNLSQENHGEITGQIQNILEGPLKTR